MSIPQERQIPPIITLACLALVWLTPLAASAQAPAAALPSAAEVFARYTNAIGGAKAIKKHRSRRIVGRFELTAQAIGGPLEILAAAPDRMLLRMELGGLGRVERGFDGTTGWSIDPGVGPRLLQGRELDELRISADFYSELKSPDQFASASVVERRPFEGRDCHVVKVVRKTGIEVTEFYDAGSGLLVGSQMTSTSAMGSVPTTVVVDEYKPFDGISMPTKVRQRAMGIEWLLTMTGVEHDRVPDNTFDLPAEIAALQATRE